MNRKIFRVHIYFDLTVQVDLSINIDTCLMGRAGSAVKPNRHLMEATCFVEMCL